MASSSRDATLYPTPHLDQYKLVGKHSLRVSPLGLGTMNFGTNWNWMGEISRDVAEQIFDKYVSSGGNFIDTANKYHEGQSEEWVGEFIAKRGIREDLVLATKFSLPMMNSQGKYTVNGAGNGRKHILWALDESLKRLQTHYVDIAYVHFHDFTTKPQELMRTLDDIVRSGKARFVAISDTPAWEVSRANMLAELRGWNEFIAYQGRYHLGERDVERDILPMCRETQMGFIPWAVLGQGKYTGRFLRDSKPSEEGRKGIRMSEKDYQISEMAIQIAKEISGAKEDLEHVSPSQVCINWILQQCGVTSALLGVRTVAQLEENVKALNFTLTKDQIARLNAVAHFEPGFPHNFIGTSVNNTPWLKDAGTIWMPQGCR